jgi:hypothetical protein
MSMSLRRSIATEDGGSSPQRLWVGLDLILESPVHGTTVQSHLVVLGDAVEGVLLVAEVHVGGAFVCKYFTDFACEWEEWEEW